MNPRNMRISGLVMMWAALAGGAAGAATNVEGEPNRLIHETSPYLQLHAYNPVDWYPWGDEALERARREDKPIFLSVGYSTCYWCHVMERQVFSNPEIAELMNRWFINIKVDREERPDIDEIYMMTTQMITGRGGWPNSVFLNPNLEPFFAGTYFPPDDSNGHPGFPTILGALARAWGAEREQIESQARRFSEAVKQALSPQSGPLAAGLPLGGVERAVADLKKRFDQQWGGFGGAPKFPSPANLTLLWTRGEAGDLEAREMVVDTLRAMGRGAIYDQLEGGFHRYTLDRAWRIPHFEKMLYDNALLAESLAIVAAATGDADLERLARGTLDFLLRVMRRPEGAFRSAIDAETEAVEGAFYIWDLESLEEALGPDDLRFLAPMLGFDGPPNFEEQAYTLYLTDSIPTWGERLGKSREALLGRIEPLLVKLAQHRAKRPFPRVDDKVLTDWNGMTIAALAQAGRLLGEDRYTSAAAEAAEFVLDLQGADGQLLHVWNQGKAKQPAFLDDYAFLIHGLLCLYQATEESRWLQASERLIVEMERRLREPSGRYFTGPADPHLWVRSSSASGGAIPAGNGMAIVNLLELAETTGLPIYRARALAAIQSFAAELNSRPAAMPTVARAVLIAERQQGAAAGPLLTAEQEFPRAETLVDARMSFGEPVTAGGWRSFELQLSIRSGWHVNANPASLDLLIPTSIAGDVRAVNYPSGTSMRSTFAIEPLDVYSGRVEIDGEVSIRNPVVRLTYQACDESRCLPPVVREILPREIEKPKKN